MSEQELQCPVCGYYCLGKGGDGCIDKPAMLRKKEELDAALWDMAERQILSASQAREAELREKLEELQRKNEGLQLAIQRVIDGIQSEAENETIRDSPYYLAKKYIAYRLQQILPIRPVEQLQLLTEAHKEIKELRKLLESKVPEGWKLVPVEPTDAMEDAGRSEFYASESYAGTVYKAMINASPEYKERT